MSVQANDRPLRARPSVVPERRVFDARQHVAVAAGVQDGDGAALVVPAQEQLAVRRPFQMLCSLAPTGPFLLPRARTSATAFSTPSSPGTRPSEVETWISSASGLASLILALMSPAHTATCPRAVTTATAWPDGDHRGQAEATWDRGSENSSVVMVVLEAEIDRGKRRRKSSEERRRELDQSGKSDAAAR